MDDHVAPVRQLDDPGVQDVADHGLHAGGQPLRVGGLAHERADLQARASQRGRQTAADHTCGTGDEDAPGTVMPDPCVVRTQGANPPPATR